MANIGSPYLLYRSTPSFDLEGACVLDKEGKDGLYDIGRNRKERKDKRLKTRQKDSPTALSQQLLTSSFLFSIFLISRIWQRGENRKIERKKTQDNNGWAVGES